MTDRARSRRLASGANGNGHTPKTLDQWADKINTAWRRSVPAIIETGQLLRQAKKALGHGNWSKMAGDDSLHMAGKLDFELRIAQMLMRVAENPVLSNAKNFSFLPPVYSTLHQLTALDPDKLQRMIEDGGVNPRLRGREAKALCNGHILPEDFCKTVMALGDLLLRLGDEPDAEMCDRLGYEFVRHLNGVFPTPAHVKEWLLPRLGARLDKMQEQWVALSSGSHGCNQTERNGRIYFREPREYADPMIEDAPPPTL
jgi:hypothetical protein